MLFITYATETGNSKNLAEKLYAKCKKRLSLEVSLDSIENLSDLWIEQSNSFIVFIISTTGEGEVTNSMRRFWNKLLRSDLPPNLFEDSSNFAIFGLGDSSYEKFNAAARKLRTRLLQLGGKEYIPAGAGDEQVDIELSFDRWMETLFGEFQKKDMIKSVVETGPFALSSHVVFYHSDSQVDLVDSRNSELVLQVVKNDRISSLEWPQEVRHLEFSLNGMESYQAGDVLNIRPRNNSDLVDRFLQLKLPNLNPNLLFKCENNRMLPSIKMTVREAFLDYLDMSGMPSRFFFEQASYFCTEEEDAEKMKEMSSHEENDAGSYLVYCKRERRSYFEVFEDFKSLNMPFERILEMIPIMRPRGYSISSSPSTHDKTIHITVAILQYLTFHKRSKIGTCSQYLRNLKENIDSIRCFISTGTLRLPSSPDAPLVLIATGTGCAPMRSLMYESLALGRDKANIYFYFGCRSSKGDFLYGSEWINVCNKLNVAFSKEESRRVPVLLARDEQFIYSQLVSRKGFLYISGSAKRMPADIRETITQMFVRVDKMTREEATKLIRSMEKERRYVVEAWS